MDYYVLVAAMDDTFWKYPPVRHDFFLEQLSNGQIPFLTQPVACTGISWNQKQIA